MKKLSIAIAIALMFVGANCFAQGKYGADSAECVKHLSYYREYMKQKNYNDALPNWRNAYRVCPPTVTENLLINGSTLLNMVASKSSGAEKAAVVDSLLKLQDERAQYYPKHAEKALNNKAGYISNYIQDDPAKAHALFTEIIETLGSKCTPSAFENDMRALIQLYNQGKAEPIEVMDFYSKATELMDAMTGATDAEKAKIADSKSNLQGLFLTSKVANCDELQRLFGERLAADPENLTLIKTVVSMLNAAENCTGNDLYLKAVVSMYRMEPSHASAYALYRMNAARGNTTEASKYLEEALAYNDLPSDKANEYTLELAKFSLASGIPSKAVAMANKLVAADYHKGEAYMVIGKAWASVRCGGDEMNRRAPYWVAVDYLQRAKAADESLANEANSLIGHYTAYFPQAAEAFMYDLTAGKSYTVSCSGMSATTTVRTNK